MVAVGLCLGFLGVSAYAKVHPADFLAFHALMQPVAVVPNPPVEIAAGSVLTDDLQQSFWVTFLTIFVAELGDKTQLATLMMSAQSRSPWTIFFGSASALVTASLISVLLGEGLAQIIPPQTLQLFAGAGFIVIGAWVLWKTEPDNPAEAPCE